MSDPYDLQRFVDAQNGVFDDVLAELRSGQKAGHWIWYIFPQIRGLGFSSMSQHYAIGSRAEAEAYLAHPILGPRLIDCTRIVNAIEGRTAKQIFSSVDAMKFRSCMTLFSEAAGGAAPEFQEALRKYFEGKPDRQTLERI